MAHPLDNALERVDRAGEHIEDLDLRIGRLTESHQASVLNDFNLESLNIAPDTLVLEVDEITFGSLAKVISAPPRFGVLIGEAVYNLRAALDYLVYELAFHDSGRRQDGTQFPIESSPQGFASRKDPNNQRGCYLRGVNAGHVARIEQLQPYNGCDWTRDLREISNPDKHRKLTATPTIVVAYITIARTPPVFGNRPVRRAHDSAGQEVYMQFPLDLSISLGNGVPIVDVLQILKLHARQTLEAFKPEF